MRILLTGATGYIGHAVAEALAQADHDVVGLARSDASAEALQETGYQVHRGDLADPDSLRDGVEQADAVIHLAMDDERGAELDPKAVEAMLDGLEGSDKSFVYTSGVWVLGHTGDRIADAGWPVHPVDIVAWRPAVEQMVLNASSRKVKSVVIRPAIVYGRGGGIPAMLVEQGREEGVVRYVGDGTQRWPFVHVEALADLYVRTLNAPAGMLLHAAHGPSYPAREVARAASYAAGCPGRIEAWPLDEARDALGDLADALALDQHISGERAERFLGWDPDAPSVLDDLKRGSYA